MASGINNTFRQVGIATGIAVLGAILESRIRSDLAGTVAAPFAKAAASGQIAAGLGTPRASQLMANAYISGLNDILLVAAIVAFAGAGLALVLVRQRDFVAVGEPAVAASH
jgi:hypothetical protein